MGLAVSGSGEEQVQCGTRPGSVVTHGAGERGLADVEQTPEQADYEVAQGSEVVRCMPGSDLAAILVEADITDPMQCFDPPVAAVEYKQVGRGRSLGRQAGDAIDDFGTGDAALARGYPAFDAPDLAHVGKVQIGVERLGDANAALLDAAVALVEGFCVTGGKRPSDGPEGLPEIAADCL